MIDLLTEYILNEGYILNDTTISCDLFKFESGESNVLLIAGLSGAGKTTLGKKLAKKYNATLFRTDWCLNEKIGIDKKQHKNRNKCYKDSFEIATKSNKRYIMEGILVYLICNQNRSFFNQCKHNPTIILGTSALKSSLRAWKRTKGEKEKLVTDFWKWYAQSLKGLNKFRKDRINISGTEVKKYII